MKKLTTLLTLIIFASSLSAQTNNKPIAQSEVANLERPKPPKQNGWQNWTFLGCAIVTATIGVLILAYDNGKEAH